MLPNIGDADDQFRHLIIRARLGESVAYRQFLIRVSEVGRGIAAHHLSLVGQDREIENVVQEVIVGVHQKLHTYDLNRKFMPWLRSVVRYKAIACLRRQGAASVPLHIEPEARAFTAARRDLLRQLDRLTPPTREPKR